MLCTRIAYIYIGARRAGERLRPRGAQVAENHSCDMFSPIESNLETLKHEFPGCNSSVVSQLSTPTARSPYLEYGLSITVITQNSIHAQCAQKFRDFKLIKSRTRTIAVVLGSLVCASRRVEWDLLIRNPNPYGTRPSLGISA